MAAALLRGGSGLGVRCVHRELCRVVWRPQAALFSSKPPDRNPPRRTHIKKAKPQPTVDINELLEKLFSQKRPGTAPPAGVKARPAKTSSVPTKPPTTSSMTGSTSDVPPLSKPAVAVFQRADQPTSSPPTSPKTSFSSPLLSSSLLNATQAFAAESLSTVTSASPPASEAAAVETVETKADTATEQLPLTSDLPLSAMEVKDVEASSFPAATVEAVTKTAVETPVESSRPPGEALEPTASVVEGPVEPAAQEAQAKSTDSGVVDVSHTVTEEALMGTTVESPVDGIILPVETLETQATLESPVEPTIDAAVDNATQEIKAKNTDLGEVNVSHAAKEEPLIETTIESPVESNLPPVEALETRASVVEGPVEPTIDAAVGDATQEVQTNTTQSGMLDISHSAKEEPVIEAAIESPVESSLPLEEALETRASVVEGPVEPAIDAAADITAQVVQAERTDPGLGVVSHAAALEALIETTIESPVDVETPETRAALVDGPVEPTIAVDNAAHEAQTTDSGNVDLSHATTVEPLIDPTIESPVGTSPPPVETLETTGATEAAGEPTIEAKADTGVVNSSHTAVEQPLVETTMEPAEESAPLPLKYEVESTVESSSGSAAVDEEVKVALLQVEEVKASGAEAMSLESVTLSEVEAEVGSLESEVLQEACESLEKEAEKLAQEEKMQAEATTEDVDVFEDTAEAGMFTLESISEITDAIEAETAVMLEVMFGSEQGPKQPTGTPPGDQELGPRDEMMGQEAEKESGGVLEAMSLESVTLAEVEASLGSLESESLSETLDYLQKEAELLAGEERMEVEEGTASAETTEALDLEFLPEVDALAEDLQTDELMEELLFTIPHHTAGVRGGQMGEEVVGADSLEAAAVDAAAAETDDRPVLPASLDEEGSTGNDEDAGMHTDLDPVQRLFLEKIREYNKMSRLNGGPLEVDPGYVKNLSEETAKLQRLYGGGDLSSFPQFTFTEPELD